MPRLLRLPVLPKPHSFRPWMVGLATLLVCLAASPRPAFAGQKDQNSNDRPKLPYNMMGLQPAEVDAYDSKAEPVAAATAAWMAVNKTGWDLVHKYFPALGKESTEHEKKVNPGDPMDAHFFANYATEDAMFSPMPLLCMVWSVPGSDVSGRLKSLHDDVASAMVLEDYSSWKLDALRQAVTGMTNSARTAQGTKYRTPKPNLSFAQALRLYAMTIALIRIETKWADKTDALPPDMKDFTNRLRHQLPVQIPDNGTAALFLYRPGVVSHPFSKEEFEERADVVVMNRKGTTIDAQQFPIYLTVDQKEWNPAWIEPADEVNDATLIARKFEHDWTRLDGPYLWYRYDELDGRVVYQSTVRLQGDQIVIEAERMIESRGGVKRTDRPADYNPLRMTAFVEGKDAPATAPDGLIVDPPKLEDQVRNLKWQPYFSNHFRVWCQFGLWTSGTTADGRYIGVPDDDPRPGGPNFAKAPATTQSAAASPSTER